MDLSLYLVTQRDHLNKDEFCNIITQAIKAGVKAVQLREKNSSVREFIEIGKLLNPIIHSFNIPLLINDRVDVALAVKADGVHLGQNDMHPKDARLLLGEDAIIGLSVENTQQSIEAEELPVNYIAASPIYPTPTKTDILEPWGLEGLRHLREISSHYIVAIGGINVSNAKAVCQAGANGIAVVSAIFNDPNPYAATQKIYKEIIS